MFSWGAKGNDFGFTAGLIMSDQTSSSLEATPPEWTGSPKGRRDLFFIALFLGLNLLIPFFIVDLYPFSRAPMFADAPLVYCDYHVFGPDGNELRPLDFGLQRNYWGNPVGQGVGFMPPASVDQFGTIAEPEAITVELQKRLAQQAELAYVDVVQDVIGDLDGQRVGITRTTRWRVENTAFQRRPGQ